VGKRRAKKALPANRFVLHRFNGDEVYRLESAVMFGMADDSGVTLWFEAKAVAAARRFASGIG
jgi:hypothetical protein